MDIYNQILQVLSHITGWSVASIEHLIPLILLACLIVFIVRAFWKLLLVFFVLLVLQHNPAIVESLLKAGQDVQHQLSQGVK